MEVCLMIICIYMTDTVKESLRIGFAEVINRESAEAYSNTPDFVIAEYLVSCLEAWNSGVTNRNNWYARGNGSYPINQNEPNGMDDY